MTSQSNCLTNTEHYVLGCLHSAQNALLPSSMYQRWVHSLMVHGLIYAVSVITLTLIFDVQFNLC